MATTLKYRFATRRRTAADWAAVNEVLLLGEWGEVIDANDRVVALKLGDGATSWNSLPYVTTDNIPEGVAKYFTELRVFNSLLQGDGISLAFNGTQTTIALTGLPIYLVDEDGNQLTDEAGNSLVDTATTGLPIPFAAVTDTPTTRDGYGITDVPLKTDPAYFPPYTMAGAPSAATSQYKAITVTDLAEGPRPCWSDGTNWRRFSDNSIAV